jgi:hypothetical protein
MAMTRLITTYLIHPHIDDQNIRNGQTKQGHFFLKHLLLRLPLWGIKPLRIDNINVTDVLKPYSLRTSLPGHSCVQDWKFSAKDIVQ